MVCKACSNEALVARWRQWKQSPKGRHHQNSWLRASLCELWNTTGSLYSDGYDRSETERVRDEVAEELGFYPDEADQNVRIDPLWAEEHRQAMTDEHMELTWDEAEGVDWFEMRGVSSELPVLREEAATVGILRQRRRAQLLDEIWSQL